jgi:hypothetical protein
MPSSKLPSLALTPETGDVGAAGASPGDRSGVGAAIGILTIASPVVMTWLLARGTGKPLLEKDIEQRRPGYADHVRRTSGFLPRPRSGPPADVPTRRSR